MGRDPLPKTVHDEAKAEVVSLCLRLVELANQLDGLSGQALSQDYADDLARQKAMRGLDELRHGLYGTLTDRQDAQASFILHKLTEQGVQDTQNDATKQAERRVTQDLCIAARRLCEAVRAL